MGRPTKELFSLMGLLILQQRFDLTDEEAVRQFAFNIEWHYALDILSESDEEKYVCSKTLWTLRKIVTEANLHTVLFEEVTGKPAEVLSVDPSYQRLDSVHIFSNMRHLGRIGLLVRTIQKFLAHLKLPSLITHVAVEPAHCHDVHALLPAIDSAKERRLAPRQLLADTLHGSDENCEKAMEQAVSVISPVRDLPEPERRYSLSDFSFSKHNKVPACPHRT